MKEKLDDRSKLLEKIKNMTKEELEIINIFVSGIEAGKGLENKEKDIK
ncbi:MAG: hypothetical protein E7K20_13605 [Clostridium sp.]|nr:hypothetical protein [Clostridium sp.]MDU1180618.1 hypothetical protein [Clostridium sp.]MDU1227886.1 hypothetical protein [Clostridium sp.]MDU7653865.1 hypothetical protein [Clostridium sp.]